MVQDPVCGMGIEENEAAGKSDYKGSTYYFCCSECKETFDKEPEAYARKGNEGHDSPHHHHH